MTDSLIAVISNPYVLLVIGFTLGVIITYLVKRSKDRISGILFVDVSEPEEGTRLFLELSRGMDYIRSQKEVHFKVSKGPDFAE